MDEYLIVESTTYASGTPSPESLLEVAQQGPPGPQGPPGVPGGTALTAVAGEALGGHRAVVLDATGQAYYASSDNPAHFGRVAGVTLGAVSPGDYATVVRSGLVTEPSWAWVGGAPIFLGHSGVLTQTPAPGFQQVIGAALSPTTAYISPREPIFTA